MVCSTALSLEDVRDARMRLEGDCEARERAMEEPIEEGERPVMRTGEC